MFYIFLRYNFFTQMKVASVLRCGDPFHFQTSIHHISWFGILEISEHYIFPVNLRFAVYFTQNRSLFKSPGGSRSFTIGQTLFYPPRKVPNIAGKVDRPQKVYKTVRVLLCLCVHFPVCPCVLVSTFPCVLVSVCSCVRVVEPGKLPQPFRQLRLLLKYVFI